MKLKLLLYLLKWFHKKVLNGKTSGESGNAVETMIILVEMFIKNKWKKNK